MKALVYENPQNLVYRDFPDPEPESNESLVRIEAVGICGSDIHAFNGHDERRPPPLILGHEAAGMVISGEKKGQMVVVNPLVVCGKCKACKIQRDNICMKREIISMPPRQGAFAEFLTIPQENLIVIPSGFCENKAALTEPLACGWHAVRRATELLDMPINESDCLVVGGGAIGVGAALSLFAKSAKRISLLESNSLRYEKLALANQFQTVRPESVDESFSGTIDLVIDSVGIDQTREISSRAVRSGGVSVNIGLGQGSGGLDVRRLTLQEITFLGTYTYTKSDFSETASAIFDGKLGDLNFFETRPLESGNIAFEEILGGRVSASKIILKP